MLAVQANKMPGPINGGRFDFDDGGTYCGGWEDGKAHGHGVCTGPKGQGEYSGSWHFGFEVSGIYTWPSGATYEGQWQNGKRHGLGVETRGRWSYKGEWTQGYKGRYGVRLSLTSNAKYEGTWASGLQDGYGSETYADGGTYQGQWMRGMRHGYGIRTSAPYGLASHSKPKLAEQNVPREAESQGTGAGGGNVSTGSGGDPASDRDKKMDDGRGGFVLKARSDEAPKERRRGSLIEKSTTMKRSIFQRLRKQRSTGDLDKKGTGSLKSAPSTTSWASTDSAASGMHPDGCEMDSNASFVTQDEQVDPQVTETYMGEWKNDKRSGFGISERTDGLKYEGEWFNNKKYGYGVTTFKDGTKEEGKYKNNILITSHKKKHMFLIRSAKFRERIEQALAAAARASKIALQKADIAVSRTAMARGKADQADIAAMHAREDADLARVCAKQFAPDFRPYGSDMPKMQQKMASGPSSGQPPQLEVTSPSGHVERTNQDHYPHHQPETSVHSSMTPMTPEMNLSPFSPHSTAQEPTHSPYDAHILGSVPNHTQQIPSVQIQQSSMYQTDFNQDQFSRPDFELGGSRLNQTPNMGFSPQSFGLQGPVPGMSMQQQQQQQQQYPPTSSAYHPQNKPMNMYGNEAGMMQDQSMGQNWMPERDQVLQQLQMQLQQQQQQQQQHQQHHQQHHHVFGPSTRNRPTRGGSVDPNELMNERFSHYDRRAPSRDRSRDSSVDRFSHRSTSRYSSRQNLPGSTPVSNPSNPFGRGNVGTLPPRIGDVGNSTGLNRANSPPANPSFTNQRSAQFGGNESPFDSPVINLDASLGYSVPSDRSDMAPSPTPSGGPKRTESLYITPVTKPKEPSAAAGLGISSSSGSGTVRKRKKSLPTTEKIGVVAGQLMSREEVAHLSHYRRQEIHRELEESARYRANPLLYLCSPNVRDWFSKQQLVLVVLIINISLAYLFFHLLT